MMQGGDLSNILYMSGEPDVACFPRFENLRVGSGPADLLDDGCATGGQITPNSILEDPMHHYGGLVIVVMGGSCCGQRVYFVWRRPGAHP